MSVCVLTDSNSGISATEAFANDVYVMPMPFYINGEMHKEGIDLDQDGFYKELEKGVDISTSMPSVGDLFEVWDGLLEKYDQVLYIPMSSGLSSSCATATSFAVEDYPGKVIVCDLQRISITQKQATYEAKALADKGLSAEEIKDQLMAIKKDSYIYIMVDTLEYLKKGGRLTPAVAAIGSLLKIKPVLKIYGEKLDTFAKGRTVKQCKQIMIDAIISDLHNKLGDPSADEVTVAIAHTNNYEAALEFKKEVEEAVGMPCKWVDPLSLSVSCHIGPGALAVGVTKNLK